MNAMVRMVGVAALWTSQSLWAAGPVDFGSASTAFIYDGGYHLNIENIVVDGSPYRVRWSLDTENYGWTQPSIVAGASSLPPASSWGGSIDFSNASAGYSYDEGSGAYTLRIGNVAVGGAGYDVSWTLDMANVVWTLAGATPTAAGGGGLTLTSGAFSEGGSIGDRYTYSMEGQCSGSNISPPLQWSGAPAGTQSFALTVVDPDGGDWVHWSAYNIPATATGLSEGQPGDAVLADGTLQGINSFGTVGYGGPCPPSGNHRYVHTLYALDTTLSLSGGEEFATLNSMMQGHILGQAALTGMRAAP